MIIIGIDPGTIVTGYGIIKDTGTSIHRVANGTIKIPNSTSLPQKLELIYNELMKIIKRNKPDEFAIETAFYGKNVQSAMKIGYARGVAILAAISSKLPVSEYSPRQIKKAVVGKGSASKEQVNYMVKTLLGLKSTTLKTDESDALATAVCHAFRINSVKRTGSNWKAFIEANPDRVI